LGGDDFAGDVDAEGVADGGVDVGDLDRAFDGFHAVLVGCADDGAALEAAAGEQGAEDAGVVDAFGKGEVGVLLAGAAEEVGFAALAEVSGFGGLA